MRKTKLRLDDPTLYETLINKQLEKYNLTIETIHEKLDENDMIDGKLWADHYTLTKEEYKEFKKWAWEYFKSNVKPYVRKEHFNKIISFFITSHGLKEE